MSTGAERDTNFILCAVFAAFAIISLYVGWRSGQVNTIIQSSSSAALNLFAAIAFATRIPAKEDTQKKEVTIPFLSFILPFFILNIHSFSAIYHLTTMEPITSTLWGIAVGVGGTILALSSIVYLRSSFAVLPAVRNVVDTGPYKYIRHPLYLGELLYVLGFMLLAISWLSLGLFIVCVGFTGWRILIEEEKLSKHSEYARYMKNVRYRILPGLF
jgi:protein-S-isoprenylcysteine O-methyltransferase Ste14